MSRKDFTPGLLGPTSKVTDEVPEDVAREFEERTAAKGDGVAGQPAVRKRISNYERRQLRFAERAKQRAEAADKQPPTGSRRNPRKRKTDGEMMVTTTIHLPVALRNKLDQVRGYYKLSEVLAQAAQDWLEKEGLA